MGTASYYLKARFHGDLYGDKASEQCAAAERKLVALLEEARACERRGRPDSIAPKRIAKALGLPAKASVGQVCAMTDGVPDEDQTHFVRDDETLTLIGHDVSRSASWEWLKGLVLGLGAERVAVTSDEDAGAMDALDLMVGLVRVEFDTRHYSFEAYGATRAKALAALQAGWKRHVEHSEADPNYLKEYEDDLSYTVVAPGLCLCDHSVIAEVK